MPLLASWAGPVQRYLAICLQFAASNLQLLRETVIFWDLLYKVHTRKRHLAQSTPDELANARLRVLKIRYGVGLPT
jgi:hypothetical protein